MPWYCNNCEKVPCGVIKSVVEEVISEYKYDESDFDLDEPYATNNWGGEIIEMGKPVCPVCNSYVEWVDKVPEENIADSNKQMSLFGSK